MASGSQAVLQSGADLGIVFDTDVDRLRAHLHCQRHFVLARPVAII
jgi:phosphomannomutase